MIVWGIDPSTVRISVAAAREPDGALLWARTLSLPKHDLRHTELALQMAAQQAWFAELCAVTRPRLIALERPFAGGARKRNVPVTSYYALGVTMAALAAGVSASVPVIDFGPTTWKMRALGKGMGHAEKGDVFAWAEAEGMTGLRWQDEADACGVARAAVGCTP